MKKQNHCLNFFKGFACILVITLHIRFPLESIDGPMQCIARFAVPLFFMISGYYCFYDHRISYMKKVPGKIKHIGEICAFSFLFWLIMQYAVCIIGTGDHRVAELTQSIFNVSAWVKFLIFNLDPVINILWFLFALLYCYLILYLCAWLNIAGVLPKLILPGLLIHFMLGNICSGLLEMTIATEYYRNVWLMGMPLFMIGHEIRANQESVLARINSNKAKLLIFSGMILALVEWRFIGGRQQMFLGSILAAIGMIVYSVCNPERKVINIISIIGQKYSSIIYVTHISVGIILDRFAKIIGIYNSIVYEYLKQTLVVILSVLFAFILVGCRKLLFTNRNRIRSKYDK